MKIVQPPLIARAAGIAALAASVVPAGAAAPGARLPAAVAAAVRDIEGTCREVGGKPGSTSAVQTADLNADGVPDYVVDVAGVNCDGAASVYGDREKGVFVYVGDGKGGAAPAFEGSAYGVRLEGSGRAARLSLTVAGQNCGKPPARDFASEAFCERPLAWNANARRFDLGPVGAAPGAAAAAPAPAVDHCGGSPRCFDAGAFVAEVIGVTPSAMTPGARHHSLTLNVRFRNVGDQPVILAYRKGSSAGSDEFGNGFAWGRPGTHDTSVKGIGYVDGRSADPQFALAPGQARNATFGLIRFNAVPPIGSTFGWDVVIDEVEVLPGQQIRSARQNSMSFAGLAPGNYRATAAEGAAGGAPVGVPAGAADAAGSVSEAAAAAQQAVGAAEKLLGIFKKKP